MKQPIAQKCLYNLCTQRCLIRFAPSFDQTPRPPPPNRLDLERSSFWQNNPQTTDYASLLIIEFDVQIVDSHTSNYSNSHRVVQIRNVSGLFNAVFGRPFCHAAQFINAECKGRASIFAFIRNTLDDRQKMPGASTKISCNELALFAYKNRSMNRVTCLAEPVEHCFVPK